MRRNEPRSTSSCAACKFLKKRCKPTCVFSPYFPSDDPVKFARIHKVFGASNVARIIAAVPEEQREEAVCSLAYEAEARVKDPVYGCITTIASLHNKMIELESDLAIAKARLAICAMNSGSGLNNPSCSNLITDNFNQELTQG